MRRPQIPNVMDFEASGFGSYSYPIEVGVVLEEGGRYCSLIKPLPQWTHWDAAAERLHGISRTQLLTIGREARLVAQDLNALLAGRRVYSDAWSVDKPWLISLFSSVNVRPDFELSPIESIQTESQHANWDKTYQKLLAEMNSVRHRASHDAYLIQTTYLQSRDLV